MEKRIKDILDSFIPDAFYPYEVRSNGQIFYLMYKHHLVNPILAFFQRIKNNFEKRSRGLPMCLPYITWKKHPNAINYNLECMDNIYILHYFNKSILGYIYAICSYYVYHIKKANAKIILNNYNNNLYLYSRFNNICCNYNNYQQPFISQDFLENSYFLLKQFTLIHSGNNTEIDININYTNYKFTNKGNISIHDKLLSNELNTIVLIESNYIIKMNSVVTSTGSTDIGLPIIHYIKGEQNNINFINNLEITTNIHPHAMNNDAFVDGASADCIFGNGTSIGKTIPVQFQTTNSTMTSAWHAHPMTRASPLIYGGLIMPFIIDDNYSTYLNQYCEINMNDIPIVFSTVDLDSNGVLNSNNLYKYSCIDTIIPISTKNTFPYLILTNIPDDPNSFKYCTSLGSWRGNFQMINYQIGQQFTPLTLSNAFTNKNPLRDYNYNYTQIFKHYINSNLLRVRLVSAETSFRRSYFGFIDENDEIIDFYVICTGNGFRKSWKTKMISLESLNRYELLIDLTHYKYVYMISYDFDITLMEKMLIISDPDNMYNFSIYTGCLFDGDNNKTLFNNPISKTYFLNILNKLRPVNKQVHDLPYFKSILFKKKGEIQYSPPIEDIINHIDNLNMSLVHYNYPGTSVTTRKIALSTGMKFKIESYTNENPDISLKFKFTKPDNNYSNIKMIENIYLDIYKIDSLNNENLYQIEFTKTTVPLTIEQLKVHINNKFINAGIHDLIYDYDKYIESLNDVTFINGVKIKITNSSNDYIYRLEGNNNIMQFMGVEYKFSSIKTPNFKEHIGIYLAQSEIDKPITTTTISRKSIQYTANVTVTIPTNTTYSGDPFGVMNDNIMNCAVKKNTTEVWEFWNTDMNFFDNHPLHFHLTSGFIDETNTDEINLNQINYGSKDVYSIKAKTKLSFKLKFINYDSTQGTVPYLGYMFHCHYMLHHDMNMMGQYYVEP